MYLFNSKAWGRTIHTMSYTRQALQNGMTPIQNGAWHLATFPRKFRPSIVKNLVLPKPMFFWPWCKQSHRHTNDFFSYDPPYSRGNIWNRLQITQNKALRASLGFPSYTSTDHIHKVANIPKIKNYAKSLLERSITKAKNYNDNISEEILSQILINLNINWSLFIFFGHKTRRSWALIVSV
jgi:hypothetical protein